MRLKRPKARVLVLGSPLHLRRVLDNLLDNAFAYGRDPEMEISCAGGYVLCRIRDHGPGIPDEELPHVLEPYYRLDSSRGGARRSFGMGLSIARGILAQHGGDLTLRNAAGGGLEVTVALPLVAGSSPPDGAPAESDE